jgi:hypothetical protein
MIRPFTLMTAMLAAIAGAYLFDVKHRAQVLDDQLAHVAQQSRLDQRQIQVLQAQWAQETDPTRLQQLAGNFTTLQPMRPSQLVTLADLRTDLPPAGSAAPADNPAVPMPVPVAAVSASNAALSPAAPLPAAPVSAALPLPPPPAPPLVTASLVIRPVVVHGLHVATRAARPRTEHQSESLLADNLPRPRPLYSPAPAAPVPQAGVTPAADTNGGSMLGMAADLDPPPQSIGN